jgi:hypothetical protein
MSTGLPHRAPEAADAEATGYNHSGFCPMNHNCGEDIQLDVVPPESRIEDFGALLSQAGKVWGR